MKKTVAIQLFGHTRSFQQTFKTLKKYIIDVNQKCDFEFHIFAHTWDELEHTDKRDHYLIDSKNVGKPLLQQHVDFIKKCYHPKKMIIDSQQALSPPTHTHNIVHSLSQKMRKHLVKLPKTFRIHFICLIN